MNPSADEMLELAKIVYRDAEVRINRHHHKPRIWVFPKEGDDFWFSPSLAGEDWQKSQALDCIVAAHRICGAVDLWETNEDPEKRVYIKGILCSMAEEGNDILTTSIRALLAGVKHG